MYSFQAKLQEIYGMEQAKVIADHIAAKIANQQPKSTKRSFNEKTAILIAYGDHIRRSNERPLQTLQSISEKYFQDIFSHVHLLPFYPYSSDDGFSVIEYTQVDPLLGDWSDIAGIETKFGLMFDYVLNHISSESSWFQAFLRDDPSYRDFFITVDPNTDVSQVRRPRTSPLLTPFETAAGIKYVWTTFGADQIDLNYANPNVLLAMIDVLLLYVRKGAEFIRMDAVTYLWKELGTNCVHLKQTHQIVQIFRDILDSVAPNVRIITETNVPHDENISYFADGHSEAQGVYNFALPPLLVHTLHTGDKRAFEGWAHTLHTPSDESFFFNFTASHDGIGVTPVKGILSQDEIRTMIARIEEYGGLVSYKTTADGGSEPYELNTTYYNALSPSAESPEIADARFIVTQAIMLALKGVPGVYFGSLLGNKNWNEGVKLLGHNRAINRQKMVIDENLAIEEIENTASSRGRIFSRYRTLLQARQTEAAFAPTADMSILDLHESIIAIRRTTKESNVTALHNVTSLKAKISLPGTHVDLLTGTTYENELVVAPYGIHWLRKK